MALGMSAADVAVSTRGMDELQSRIKTLATTAKGIASSTGTDFKALEAKIREYWNGVDCENFIKDLKKAATQLETAVDNYHKSLSNGLTNYVSSFKDMQSTTYRENQINIKI